MEVLDLEMLRLARILNGRFYPVEDVEVGDYVEACFMEPRLILGDPYVGKVVSISNHEEGLQFIDILIVGVRLTPFTYCFCNRNSYWRKIPKSILETKE